MWPKKYVEKKLIPYLMLQHEISKKEGKTFYSHTYKL